MASIYSIAIVGAGPAGISAACRAAEMGDSHLLLESQEHIADTIFRYQKGKHVMAEPRSLPLRASADFDAGRREQILAAWQRNLANRGVNLKTGAKIREIRKVEDVFHLLAEDGQAYQSHSVILAIGVQGNQRKMQVPGENLPGIQYQLDDPDEYSDETIVIVGAGDAAIENAIALSRRNSVHIVNRKAEFSRAKDGNVSLIADAIDQGRVQCHYEAAPLGVEPLESGPENFRLSLNLESKSGAKSIACNRIIARLGAIPPREFLEGCGIKFVGSEASSLPIVSSSYESSVKGLYVIGALAGYPLIKQAMNQGYEAVEFVRGRPVVPADEPILAEKFKAFSESPNVDAFLDVIGMRSPLLSSLNRLQLRELLLESRVFRAPSVTIYKEGDYGSSVFVILAGTVSVSVSNADGRKVSSLKAGKIFGELALISGRPRSATVVAGKDCVLLEIPRNVMLKLLGNSEVAKKYIDRTFATRALHRYIFRYQEEDVVKKLVENAQIREFKAGDFLFRQGESSDSLHLIRSGSVMLSLASKKGDVVQQYCAAGQYVGEVDVIAGLRRGVTATAAIRTETIEIPALDFRVLLEKSPELVDQIKHKYRNQIQLRMAMERSPQSGARMQFLLKEGLGEATDALLIDEDLCIRCDQCEKACASTHGNLSRLDREAGATFDGLHVPTSCRHCEHPHCMKDCPPNAIHRAANGEVFIDETCIGCGNCERNCPYGVIQMGVEQAIGPSLWRQMLAGIIGKDRETEKLKGENIKKAVKCDMCVGAATGPACVHACPTGAAIRISPEKYFEVLANDRR